MGRTESRDAILHGRNEEFKDPGKNAMAAKAVPSCGEKLWMTELASGAMSHRRYDAPRAALDKGTAMSFRSPSKYWIFLPRYETSACQGIERMPEEAGKEVT